ncbi:MAG TPA: acyltransferase [Candidatus Acidoferrales bacterium]|nr:acyltransferase [Candidatus Acidoferrales bacterium]
MRLKQLDILRAVAILLVLGRHHYLVESWHRVGWTGVDLFFVLSGFLISGLLFTEYKTHGRIRVGHFLIRRGFKIYPPFYVMIAWTTGMFLLYHNRVPWSRFFSEIFFVQSYFTPLWVPTWSLAVEEHFYLALPILLLVFARLSKDRVNPFSALPKLCLVVAVVVLGLRFLSVSSSAAFVMERYSQTHLHVDSLLFGVLISYFYHFRPADFQRFAQKRGVWLGAVCCLCVAPCFFLELERSYFIQTVGQTLLYLGYGSLLILAVPLAGSSQGPPIPILGRLGSWLASIGKYSYSIYLWHGPMQDWGLALLQRKGLLPASRIAEFWIYFACSIILGVMMAKIVEYPALKIRDRLFPSRSGAVAPAAEEAPPAVTGAIAAPDQVTA